MVFDMMVSPLQFPSTGVYGGNGDGFRTTSSSVGFDDDDMEYSLQPLAYMTSIGEHLLLMVQLLAPLARGDIRRHSPVRLRVTFVAFCSGCRCLYLPDVLSYHAWSTCPPCHFVLEMVVDGPSGLYKVRPWVVE
jgi:hypothetical protein